MGDSQASELGLGSSAAPSCEGIVQLKITRCRTGCHPQRVLSARSSRAAMKPELPAERRFQIGPVLPSNSGRHLVGGTRCTGCRRSGTHRDEAAAPIGFAPARSRRSSGPPRPFRRRGVATTRIASGAMGGSAAAPADGGAATEVAINQNVSFASPALSRCRATIVRRLRRRTSHSPTRRRSQPGGGRVVGRRPVDRQRAPGCRSAEEA
jgi:hypothetical protein